MKRRRPLEPGTLSAYRGGEAGQRLRWAGGCAENGSASKLRLGEPARRCGRRTDGAATVPTSAGGANCRIAPVRRLWRGSGSAIAAGEPARRPAAGKEFTGGMERPRALSAAPGIVCLRHRMEIHLV